MPAINKHLLAWTALTLAVTCCPRLAAADTAFETLAFVSDTSPEPEVNLPDHPSLNWSRVQFRPQRTNDFPEDLKPARVLASPADQITGVAVAGEHLWVVSRATRRVYRLQAKTGAVQGDFACPDGNPVGLCRDGRLLWLGDRQLRCVFALDDAGQVVKRFPVAFEPSSVFRAADGLLVSDWAKDEFHRLDPETGRELGTERAADDHLTGLTSAGRYVWCSRGDEIIRFDRERGLPVCGFSVAPPEPGACALAGLAADGDALWYANSASNQLVQIRLPKHGAWVASHGRVRQAGFEMAYRNTSEKPVESFSVLQHVPVLEMPGQRYLALRIQPAPRALFRDDLGNVVALLNFGRLDAGQSVRCQIATTMWVADRRMVMDPNLVDARALSPEQRAYTRSFHPIAGEDSAEVKAFVEQAVGGETNAYWRIRKAHDALCRAIYYREPADESVPGVLRQGYGVCRNYSAAMESFGRLLGVPVLNAWAPRHETCLLLLPGVSPAVMEVTANDSGPDPATTWRRSRWFLGTSADEITTGVRGYAMHGRLLVEGVPYTYQWHYWIPVAVRGIRHDGWWTVTDPATGKTRRL
jgi:transglutaminase-like putative cysteine protease